MRFYGFPGLPVIKMIRWMIREYFGMKVVDSQICLVLTDITTAQTAQLLPGYRSEYQSWQPDGTQA